MPRTPDSSTDVADVARRYWPLWAGMLAVLVAGVLLGRVLIGIVDRADEHATRTQQALCSLIDSYPIGVQANIDHARRIGDCGKPHQPTVFLGRPSPSRTVIVSPTPVPGRTVVIVSPALRAHPSATPTATRSPTPQPTHTPSPHPTPRPTKTPCLIPGVPPGCGN